jgi:hypothetical protein
MVIIKWVLKKQDNVMWAGLMLLRRGAGGGRTAVNTALLLRFQQFGKFDWLRSRGTHCVWLQLTGEPRLEQLYLYV